MRPDPNTVQCPNCGAGIGMRCQLVTRVGVIAKRSHNERARAARDVNRMTNHPSTPPGCAADEKASA